MKQQATRRVTLAVSGMSCGGCAADLERTLARVAGVQQARVEFASGQATLEYDPSRTDVQALTAQIVAAGHQVRPLS
jgi:P-type Cu+ transporter